jgi:hypothetical protein
MLSTIADIIRDLLSFVGVLAVLLDAVMGPALTSRAIDVAVLR